MGISRSKELFVNQEIVPEYDPKKHFFEQKKSVYDFYKEEHRRVREGLKINGYFIHPLMYWHINYFKTPIPIKGEEKIITPPLDDNFMYFVDSYTEAQKRDLGVGLFGSRGFGKSSLLASCTSWTSVTRPNGVSSIIGGSDGDLGAISNLMEKHFTNIHPAFHIPRLVSDWSSNIEFGVRKKNNEKLVHSQIAITNANKGSKKESEKGAGLSPVNFIVDEALHEDCIVYTEHGIKTMKEVQPGDRIYGADGELTIVESKIDPGVVDTYKITLSDGRFVIVSGNHKWKVFDQNIKDADKWTIKTTDNIREKYYYKKYDSRYGKTHKSFRYSIPNSKPLNRPTIPLPLDPYWLGLWLADGLSANQTITTPDKFIVDYYTEYAKILGLDVSVRDEDGFYRVRAVKSDSERYNPLLDMLKSMDLRGNKHIPEIYLNSSIEQRLELLRGLMDADGSVFKNGAIEFSSSIPKLAKGFKELCRGLGISIRERIKKPHYRDENGNKVMCKNSHVFRIHTDLDIFKHPSKKVRISDDQSSYNYKKKRSYIEKISIVNIEYVGKNQVYCIGVDNKDKLFLTDDYIVTHNCGKFNPKGVLNSAIPSFMTPDGAKLVHLVVGTGGNSELSKDAKYILEHPEAFRLLPMDFDRLERGVPEAMITWRESYKDAFCTFVPGQMSYRLKTKKKPKKLSEFLDIKSKDLDKITINVTDWEDADKRLKEDYKIVEKSLDETNKLTMYFPQKISDCFLTDAPNPFPVSIINKRIKELEDSGNIGKDVELWKDGAITKHNLSDKKRSEVSHPGGVSDAPIISFGDIPESPPPKWAYVSGHDGYKVDVSDTDSLGTFYVIKRRNLEPNQPCETIAASYSARPDRMRDFLTNGQKMVRTWNAMCCMESIDTGFQHHLETKGLAYDYLAPAFTFSNSTPNGRFGLFPSTGNNTVRFNLLIDYCKEEHTIGIDDDGTEIIKYGVEFIDDVDLLKEMRDYKKGGNFDRITAFSHALVYARELDKKFIRPKEKRKEREPGHYQGSNTRKFKSKHKRYSYSSKIKKY